MNLLSMTLCCCESEPTTREIPGRNACTHCFTPTITIARCKCKSGVYCKNVKRNDQAYLNDFKRSMKPPKTSQSISFFQFTNHQTGPIFLLLHVRPKELIVCHGYILFQLLSLWQRFSDNFWSAIQTWYKVARTTWLDSSFVYDAWLITDMNYSHLTDFLRELGGKIDINF